MKHSGFEKVAFFYATFPRPTETFVRRELKALHERGFSPTVFSIWRGAQMWEEIRINRFKLFNLWSLPFWILYWSWKHPSAFCEVLNALWNRPCPSFQNWNETFLGLGYALVQAKTIENQNFKLFHGVWATMPATAAFALSKLLNIPFSMGAHAYDVFRKGGDWILREKIMSASMIRTSSKSSAMRLVQIAKNEEKIRVIRRGLSKWPVRDSFEPVKFGEIKLISVGRLVEKKGYFKLLHILSLLKKRNRVTFKMKIVGDGPLHNQLNEEIKRLSLSSHVEMLGARSEKQVNDLFLNSDIMIFTGVIASNGDRDGIPNVIPEAMAAGCLVLGSSKAGASEAFIDGVSGFSLNPYSPFDWVKVLEDFAHKPKFYSAMRKKARIETHERFNVSRTAGKLISTFQEINSEQ